MQDVRNHLRGLTTIVLTRPLQACEWELVEAFVRRCDREALRLRFGAADFTDAATLRRLFDVQPGSGEQIWLAEPDGAIAGIVHLALLSPGAAEIAFMVRTDMRRAGIGERLARTAIARAAGEKLTTLKALILPENRAALRLARKLGFAPTSASGLTIEYELDLVRGSTLASGASPPARDKRLPAAPLSSSAVSAVFHP